MCSCLWCIVWCCFVFKQKTAYEMRISDWSSDVCSSDLLQTVLSPEDDVVNLVIAHHPPDWCKDTDEIEDDLNDRAAVHLFGHKHRQRVIRDERFVRIGAAAVNPDPTELQFEPGIQSHPTTEIGRASCRERGCQ